MLGVVSEIGPNLDQGAEPGSVEDVIIGVEEEEPPVVRDAVMVKADLVGVMEARAADRRDGES